MSHPTTTLALLDALQEKWHQRFMALSAKDSEKRVGQAVSEAANDLGDIIEAYESERLASDEPADQIRTYSEALNSRIVIPHASFSFEMTSDGISPDLYATLTGHPVAVEDDDAEPRPEPADITEEPPVGSRLKDCHWSVWRRGERGWGIEGLIPGSNFDNLWSTVQQYAPLTALDEPADITEEPPVDSQVSVAQRDLVADELWNQMIGVAKSAMRDAMEEAFDVAGIAVADYAPLRPTTDADRERVGLPVEPAPADVEGAERSSEPDGDLNEVESPDSDEAWARERWAESANIASWSALHPETQRVLVDFARAAREHLMARETYTEEGGRILIGELAENRRRAEKAEANLARVTDARDRHSRAADKWCNLYADKCEEIESVQAKADRYDALRADVDREYINARDVRDHRTQAVFGAILNRDTERAES